MCVINYALSLGDKERIFGIEEAAEANIEGLELRYEVEHKQEREPYYLRQRIYRDKGGKYYLAVKGGADATAMLSIETWYYPDGREVLIPVRPEALAIWLRHNLHGDEYERALEEFKSPETLKHETVWTYQQDGIYEFLWKADNNLYVLFSTDPDYPCPGFNMPYIEFNEDGTDNSRDDLYIYYVVQETARRWAETRGMDEATCKEVFGRCT